MHLQTRGSRTYVYDTIREGKQVKRVYLGRESCARELMVLQELAREKKAFEKKIAAEEQAALWPLQQRMFLLRKEAKLGLEALHLATNHYRSPCRHWRRRKRMDATSEKLSVVGSNEPSRESPVTPDESRPGRDAELQVICDEIKAGKNHLRPKLRRLLLQEKPEDIERIGDLSRFVVDQWAGKLSPKNAMIREAIAITANKDRLALAPTGSTYVERVLADRLVLARLQQSFHELRMTAIADQVDAAGSRISIAMERRLRDSNRELRDATKQYLSLIHI